MSHTRENIVKSYSNEGCFSPWLFKIYKLNNDSLRELFQIYAGITPLTKVHLESKNDIELDYIELASSYQQYGIRIYSDGNVVQSPESKPGILADEFYIPKSVEYLKSENLWTPSAHNTVKTGSSEEE